MRCVRPVQFYKTEKGLVHHNPNSQYAFTAFHPCGTCIACRIRHATCYAVRAVHESQMHSTSCMVTLTYEGDVSPSLDYDDVTLFIKRTREFYRANGISELRYKRVGEYGGKLGRPHFHIHFFGIDFCENLTYKKSPNIVRLLSSDFAQRRTSSLLENLWGFGSVQIEPLDFSTAMYLGKYICKKHPKSHYAKLGLQPEKSSSSKANPIGHSWLKKYWTDVYPSDRVVINGVILPVPRSYDEWLETNQPSVYADVKNARTENQLASFDEVANFAKFVKLVNSSDPSRSLDKTLEISYYQRLLADGQLSTTRYSV